MAEQEKDPLFPVLPEDLKSLSDDEVQKLLDDSVAAAALIDADDEEFLAGLTADEIIEQYAAGVESITSRQFIEIWTRKMARFGGDVTTPIVGSLEVASKGQF